LPTGVCSSAAAQPRVIYGLTPRPNPTLAGAKLTFAWDLSCANSQPLSSLPDSQEDLDPLEARFGITRGQHESHLTNGPRLGGLRAPTSVAINPGEFIVLYTDAADEWSFEVAGRSLWLAQIMCVADGNTRCQWWARAGGNNKFHRQRRTDNMTLATENIVTTFPKLNSNNHLPKNVERRIEAVLAAAANAVKNAQCCCAACGVDKEDSFVECDRCCKLWHTGCANYPVMVGHDWWCRACRAACEPHASSARREASGSGS